MSIPLRCALATCLGAVLVGRTVSADAPQLSHLYPSGARTGSRLQVTAVGSFRSWPVDVWCDRSDVEVNAAAKSGELTIDLSRGARPGVAWIRLYNNTGASALRPFLVGTLPDTLETEPNDSMRDSQALPSSALNVHGKLQKSRDVDVYSLELTRGQVLVAAVEANTRLGSPMDTVLQVLSAGGDVLAQNDDTLGLDPRLVFTVPADGRYGVRLFAFSAQPNTTIRFASGDTFVYLLTLTTAGFIDHSVPLGLSPGAFDAVETRGWGLPAGMRLQPVVATPDASSALVYRHDIAPVLEIPLLAHPGLIEKEPNGLEAPQPIAPPVSISGAIESPDDIDIFAFTVEKGERLELQVLSRSLGFELDALLRVLDASGNQLSRVDDTGGSRDPSTTFTAPETGDYRVEVTDLNRASGLRYAYLLSVAAPSADYSLAVATDRFVLKPGTPLEIPVTVERRNGFGERIEITASGLPEGVVVAPVESPGKGDAAKKVTLTLSAASGPVSGGFRIRGAAGDESQPIRLARGPVDGIATTVSDLWLTVPAPKAKPPPAKE